MLERRTLLTLVAVLGFSVAANSCSEATGPSVGPAAKLDVIAGDAQSGVVGKELSQALAVRVLDAGGLAVLGQLVNFRVAGGGGSVFAGSALTNSDGIARERWTLGTTAADTQAVEARAVDRLTGDRIVFQVFHAVGVADVPAAITGTTGVAQVVSPGTLAPDSLALRVNDEYGNPVPNVVVAWTVSAGGGTVSRTSDTTTSAGLSRTHWTSPTTVGAYTIIATVPGLAPVTFAESVVAAPPAQILVESAGSASATVGTSVQPVLRVVDSFGNGVPGATVTFTTTAGNGAAPSAVSTDAGGRVNPTWTLGTVAGVNALRVDVTGVTSVSLQATGVPDAPQLTKALGDDQRGAPGSALPVAPTVLVADRYGNPVAGVAIAFSVLSGGGSVVSLTASTDVTGRATSGTWTLGAVRGTQSLQASATGLPVVTFSAVAQVVSADVSVSITAPSANAAAGDSLPVVATVTFVRQLASVHAVVGSNDVLLSNGGTGTVFKGTVQLAGVPRDTATLVVTAQDVSGATTEVVRVFVHDRKPVITIASPVEGDVARSTIAISATCADDDSAGCSSLVVRTGDQTVLSGSASVSGTVSLASFNGGSVNVTFIATDSRGQSTVVTRAVQVESSTHLVAIGSATDGTLWDYANGRALVKSGNAFRIATLATGATDSVPVSASVGQGLLTPQGALFSQGTNLYDWRAGTLSTLTNLSSSSFDGEGAYALFVRGAGFGELVRRDLSTGADLLIANNAGNYQNSVAANGDVAFWTSSYVVDFVRGGVTAQVSDDSTGSRWSVYPRTDGVSVVYAQTGPNVTAPYSIVLANTSPGPNSVLASGFSFRPSPGPHYAVRNGWTAFAKPDFAGVLQVWTRAPDGILRQISSTGSSSTIVALGDDGSVIFTSGSTGQRYLATSAGAAEAISSTLGTVLWRDGGFVEILGRWAYSIVP